MVGVASCLLFQTCFVSSWDILAKWLGALHFHTIIPKKFRSKRRIKKAPFLILLREGQAQTTNGGAAINRDGEENPKRSKNNDRSRWKPRSRRKPDEEKSEDDRNVDARIRNLTIARVWRTIDNPNNNRKYFVENTGLSSTVRKMRRHRSSYGCDCAAAQLRKRKPFPFSSLLISSETRHSLDRAENKKERKKHVLRNRKPNSGKKWEMELAPKTKMLPAEQRFISLAIFLFNYLTAFACGKKKRKKCWKMEKCFRVEENKSLIWPPGAG